MAVHGSDRPHQPRGVAQREPERLHRRPRFNIFTTTAPDPPAIPSSAAAPRSVPPHLDSFLQLILEHASAVRPASTSGEMNGGGEGPTDDSPDLFERQTLCISRPKPDYVLHCGDDGFKQELRAWYDTAENNAAEKLVKLKAALQRAETEEFWTMATEGLADITDAQYAFISKRMLIDEEDAAVEMPPLGEPGSCLMSQALYFNDGQGNAGNPRNVKYTAYGCPCAHMKHDKVFVVPEHLSQVIPNNPNKAALVVPPEGYLAVPLTYEGRCFAHFGVMWSAEGVARRKLSFAFMEMMFHSLEDILLNGFLERGHFSKAVKSQEAKNVIPHEAVTATQSLKPYARSLSHELRTPMQGVVGMLDIMYATVQEAAEGQRDPRVRAVLDALRENIEVVQGEYFWYVMLLIINNPADSSRRAVEAADNVVHAYDMNMGVPEAPISPPEDDENPDRKTAGAPDRRPDIVVTGEHIPIQMKNTKRRRESSNERSGKSKRTRTDEGPSRSSSRHASQSASGTSVAANYRITSEPAQEVVDVEMASQVSSQMSPQARLHVDNVPTDSPTPERTVPHGLRNTNLRDVLQYLVNDLLKVGGRPDSAIAQDTENGEEIEVRVKNTAGQEKVKMVKWIVDPAVPETILIDEKDLAKMISCVFLNAVKFTEEGQITLTARLSPRLRYVVINIRDTGPGIPEAFLPNLFKPFSKEDDSTTRHSEGLGLGLLVAKGLARKLGGDLTCIRAETSGPNRGTEFEMRVPCTPSDTVSRPVTPFGSPTPSHRSRHSADIEHAPTPYDIYHLASAGGHCSPRPSSSHGRRNSKTRPSRTPPTLIRQRASVTTATPTPLPAPKPQTKTKRSPPVPARADTTDFDRKLAQKYPLTFLVVEDNKINRKLLVNMLRKLGYADIYEAYDGGDAVRQMQQLVAAAGEGASVEQGGAVGSGPASNGATTTAAAAATPLSPLPAKMVDVVLMDLWMPFMDGYEATERILAMDYSGLLRVAATADKVVPPTILAVTADVTGGALERAEKVGMKGFLSKPFKLRDLQKLILEYCATLPEESPLGEHDGGVGGVVAPP